MDDTGAHLHPGGGATNEQHDGATSFVDIRWTESWFGNGQHNCANQIGTRGGVWCSAEA